MKIVNLKIIETQLQKNNFLDENNIYIYASKKYLLEGICGRIKGLVLLSICKDTLYVHHANIDNSYGEQLAKIHIPDMKNIRGKAGMFGGKFSFNYDGKEYKFKLPAKAEKFVDFFRKVKTRG